MGEICEKCRLANLLKEKKKILDTMIEERNFNLLDDEVIKLSIDVDEIIYKYILIEEKYII